MQLKKLLTQIIKVIVGLIAVAYPIVVFVALKNHVSLRLIGLWLVCVVLVMAGRYRNIWSMVAGLMIAGLAMVANSAIFIKLYPVVMNAVMCVAFAVSLRGVPLIQRFAARLRYDITPAAIKYMRRVTVAWAIFMGINTLVSIVTVFLSDAVWALYNGLISYCLIGTMIGVEYLIRCLVHAGSGNK